MIDNIKVKLKTTVMLLGIETDKQISIKQHVDDAKKQTLKLTHQNELERI